MGPAVTVDAIRWAFGMVFLIGSMAWCFSVLFRSTLTLEELDRELLGENIQGKHTRDIMLGDLQRLHSWAIHNGPLAFLATFLGMALLVWLAFA
jgi:hypothetical protein